MKLIMIYLKDGIYGAKDSVLFVEKQSLATAHSESASEQSYPDVVKYFEIPEGVDTSLNDFSLDENSELVVTPSPAKVAAAALANKQHQILERYNQMNADVYAQMDAVFGTSKPDSAIAFHETFKIMKSKPVLFWEKGLKAEREVGSFQVGDALNTIQLVEDYADAMLQSIEDYGVWRMDRIKQFQDEKAAILAG